MDLGTAERKFNMILTPRDFKAFGFKHVIEYDMPVIMVCGKAISAKTFRYEKLEDLKKEEWFKDSLALQSPILLCKLKDNHPDLIFRMFHF